MATFSFNYPATVSERERRIYFRRIDEPDYGDPVEEEIIPEGPWRFLPTCALYKVFSHLSDGARFNASLTCRAWNDMFNHPNLWRRRAFKFYGYRKVAADMEKALAFSKRFGQHLQSLILTCEHPTYAVCKKFQKTVTDVCGILIWRACELKELSIPRLHTDRYWRHDPTRHRLISSFSKFLKKQTNLRTFDMADAGCTIGDGLHILEALVIGIKGKRRLKVLNIEDFFHTRIAVFRVGKFLHAMAQIKGLQSLYLNYNCLSEDVINILTRTCATTLKFLSIKVYKLDPHFQQIPSICWRKFSHACPGLKVNLYFECIGEYYEIKRVLCPDIPLRSLHIWTGLHPQDLSWQLTDTLKYIGDNFPRKLEELSLGVESGRESIDEAFLYMLQKLKMLELLDVQAELTLETAEAILQKQQEYKIGLLKCHLTLDHLMPMEMEDLAELMEKYEVMIEDRALDFQFLANESILI